MTQNVYYLHLENGKVIGHHSHEIDSKILPSGEKIVPKRTDNPSQFIGLFEAQINLDPLPKPQDGTDKTTLSYRRNELKTLFYELTFTRELGEDTVALETIYETKLEEYNLLKE